MEEPRERAKQQQHLVSSPDVDINVNNSESGIIYSDALRLALCAGGGVIFGFSAEKGRGINN